MEYFFNSGLFAAAVIGASTLGLLTLLIIINRHYLQKDAQDKLEIATDLFQGDRAAAQLWLSTPEKSLAYKRPLDASVEEVRIVAERLNRGIVL